jgi:molecular chaperone GrpE (heat shock protein)
LGFFEKLFGADEGDRPKEKSDDGKPERASPQPSASPGGASEPASAPGASGASGASAEAPREPAAPARVARVMPADIAAEFGAGGRVPREVRALVDAAVQHVERTALGFEQVLAGIQTLTGMLQATAKSAARGDQERKQQFLELRAHLTSETDRLIGSMRDDVTREASVELFKAVLPALDEVDHVLRQSEAGAEVRAESVRIVRRRLRDALSRLGIEETPVAPRETTFDAEFHEGRPYEGDPEAIAGLAPRVVVDVERNGWTGFGKVLRHALVTVVKE